MILLQLNTEVYHGKTRIQPKALPKRPNDVMAATAKALTGNKLYASSITMPGPGKATTWQVLFKPVVSGASGCAACRWLTRGSTL